MKNKFTVLGLALLSLVIVGAGCAKNFGTSSQTPVDNMVKDVSSTEESYLTYVWKEYGITFNYPKKVFVTSDGFNMLGFSDNPNKGFDLSGETLLIDGNEKVEGMIKAYKRYPKYFKSQTTEKIGKYSFAKIEYYSPAAGRYLPHYFLQINDNLTLEYTYAGIGDAELILSSLKF